jgi:hypothetical protein
LLTVTLIFVSALPAIAAEADLTLAYIEPLTAFNDTYLPHAGCSSTLQVNTRVTGLTGV